jgi:integrase
MGKRGNGEGSISKRSDGRWVARVSIHTPEGRKRKAFYGKTRKEAVEKMAVWQGKPETYDTRITVAEWMDSWLAGAGKSVGEGTRKRYASYVRSVINPRIGGIRLAWLTPEALEDFRDDLLSKGYAPETVKHALGTVSTACGKAARRGLIPKNPVSEVKRPKTPKKMRPLSEAQVASLLSVVAGTRWEAVYRLAGTVGLRHGELHALFWTDLDAERGTLAVERSVDTHGAPRWGRTKTEEEREILLPAPVRECLERHRKMQSKEKLAAKSWEDPRLIFPNQRGGVHRRNSVRRLFKRHLAEAELPDIRFHDLRHTAATLMLRAGVDVATTAAILGHADPAITLRRYSHVLSDMQREASEKMAGYNF